MKDIWILTEERPKDNVIQKILEKISDDYKFSLSINKLQILPVVRDGVFTFVYKVDGVVSDSFQDVYIKIASGSSSFVDFLIFIQKNEPTQTDKPLYAIEETKTDDSESRNTGIYQRCSKFVYVEFYYPGIRKIMLYNLQITQKVKPTGTNIFGMRMLKTVGVEVMGKVYAENLISPFTSLDELIKTKNAMRKAPKGNIPILIEEHPDKITISGRLYKKGSLSYDPNIGALTLIALCIRKWEKTKEIVITQHGLQRIHLGESNKFIQIAHRLNIHLEGLELPILTPHIEYWHYEMSKEKMATIFLHVALLAYSSAKVVYANHGGSERGYYMHALRGPIPIPKYQLGKRDLYKAGDKKMIIYLPDMIIYDEARKQFINVEGKKYSIRSAGIKELANYDYIESEIMKTSGERVDSIIRTVVVFGGVAITLNEPEISFLLNTKGEMILGTTAPPLFRDVIKKVLSTSQ